MLVYKNSGAGAGGWNTFILPMLIQFLMFVQQIMESSALISKVGCAGLLISPLNNVGCELVHIEAKSNQVQFL